MTTENKFPSQAFTDAKGNYHFDPLNQPLAQQEADGLTGARPTGQREHITKMRGYCQAHKVLGCETCSGSTPVLL